MTKAGKQCGKPVREGTDFCQSHYDGHIRPLVRKAAPGHRLPLPPSIMLTEMIDRAAARVRWLSEQIEKEKQKGTPPAVIMELMPSVIAWEQTEKEHLRRLIELALRAGIDPVVVGGAEIFVHRVTSAFREALRMRGLSDEEVDATCRAAAVLLRQTRPTYN